eukprot:7167909-Prymnesium_polylepis.1
MARLLSMRMQAGQAGESTIAGGASVRLLLMHTALEMLHETTMLFERTSAELTAPHTRIVVEVVVIHLVGDVAKRCASR